MVTSPLTRPSSTTTASSWPRSGGRLSSELDQSQDIAVLQLAAASGLKTVSVGASSAVKSGQQVMALGNAGGKGGTPAAAIGTITALGQSITAVDQPTGITEQLTGLIRTNVPLQPGDSGGPLVSGAGVVEVTAGTRPPQPAWPLAT